MSEQSNPSDYRQRKYKGKVTRDNGEEADLHFPGELDLILAHRDKINAFSQQDNQLINQITPSDEPLALILDKDRIQAILDKPGCHSLVAFFAVSDPTDLSSKKTLVITGMDEDRKVLTHETDQGFFTDLDQTWETLLHSVHDEVSFREFFRIS